MRRALDYTRMPSPALPLRFLLAAPWFGAAAGMVAAWHGADLFASRWSGAALAATHLITLGFLSMTMAGSLLQMLPSVAGLPLRAAPLAARWCCPLLGLGTAVLAAAFLSGHPLLFAAAVPVLGAAFALLLACLLPSLWQRRAAPPAAVRHIAAGMRGAAAALVACVAAGLALAAWLGGGPAVPVPALVDSHAALGLAGWVALLVVAVSFQVIPMFQGTDPYPPVLARRLVPLLMLALALWLAGRWMEGGWRRLPALAVAALLALHAFAGLRLLARRRHAGPKPGTGYWRLCMAALAAAAGLAAWPGEPSDARTLASGVCYLAGFAMSAVNGMLYKIVPFLAWYHLRERAVTGQRVAKMAELIGDERVRVQCRWHLAAVLAAIGACWWVPLARPSGLLLAFACLRLGLDLARPLLRHPDLLRLQAS